MLLTILLSSSSNDWAPNSRIWDISLWYLAMMRSKSRAQEKHVCSLWNPGTEWVNSVIRSVTWHGHVLLLWSYKPILTLNQSESGSLNIQGKGPKRIDLDIFGGKITCESNFVGEGRKFQLKSKPEDFSVVIDRKWIRTVRITCPPWIRYCWVSNIPLYVNKNGNKVKLERCEERFEVYESAVITDPSSWIIRC